LATKNEKRKEKKSWGERKIEEEKNQEQRAWKQAEKIRREGDKKGVHALKFRKSWQVGLISIHKPGKNWSHSSV